MPIGAAGGKFLKIVNLFVYFQRKYGKDIHVLIPAGKSKNFQLIFTKFSFSLIVMPMGGEVSPSSPPLPYATAAVPIGAAGAKNWEF